MYTLKWFLEVTNKSKVGLKLQLSGIFTSYKVDSRFLQVQGTL